MRCRKLLFSLLVTCLSYLSVSAQAAATTDDFKVTTLQQGLGVVWGMALTAPDQLLFTDRSGRVGLLSLAKNAPPVWLQGVPPVWAQGQGGLLDIAVPANYQPGGWIYFTYSKPVSAGGATTLARARLQAQSLVDWQDLLVTDSASDKGQHFGSRIAFDGAGHLFFSVGDRGHRPNGQDLASHAGTIIRLNLDGTVPSDNPFIGRPDALPEIWSYGHRNPQGLCYDNARKILWSSEHGPRGGDEINSILPGRNYGWAEVSHGKEYWKPVAVGEATERADVTPASYIYIPSIAPGSLLCYSGKAFAEWQGNLLQGSLKLAHLNKVQVNTNGKIDNETRLLTELGERMRSLLQDDQGNLLIGTDSGRILKVEPLQ